MGGHAVHIPIQQDCDSGNPCGPRGLGLELEGGGLGGLSGVLDKLPVSYPQEGCPGPLCLSVSPLYVSLFMSLSPSFSIFVSQSGLLFVFASFVSASVSVPLSLTFSLSQSFYVSVPISLFVTICLCCKSLS